MGVRIHKIDDDTITYSVVPEVIQNEKQVRDEFSQRQRDHLHDKGWTKDKSMRYRGSIPLEMYYNIPQGVAANDYWCEETIDKFFQDFPVFEVTKK